MAEPVDVAIIGAGGAGYPAAFLLDAAGRRVLLADPIGNLGGDCLAEGCVPSKAVREAALSYRRARYGPLASPAWDSASVWQAALQHKDAVQKQRYEQHRKELAASSVEFVAGRARVVARNEIEVETDGGEVRRVGFRDVVVATGAAPSRLPIPGAELAATSHDLFRVGADLPFPERPVIIGGGYIGVETAVMLEHLGAAPSSSSSPTSSSPGSTESSPSSWHARSAGGSVSSSAPRPPASSGPVPTSWCDTDPSRITRASKRRARCQVTWSSWQPAGPRCFQRASSTSR